MAPTVHLAHRAVLLVAAALISSVSLAGSGFVGVYGIIEKVVFEPNEQAPERLQIWGAFAYADGGTGATGQISPARRGYLYFALPPGTEFAALAKLEWMDLKSVAGTGQAVAFGAWGYWGTFDGLDPAEPYRGVRLNGGLRVRQANEPPAAAIAYPPNVGVVKIPAQGSRRDVVLQLQQQLGTR